MTTDYLEFLKTKEHKAIDSGIKINREDIHPSLFEWQKDIVVWSCRKGRCAVFLDTGLGKTRISLEWARLLDIKVLIIAPLSVARQTVREALKINIKIKYVRSQSEVIGDNKIWITNYEMIEHFDPDYWDGVILDESSILKGLSSKTRIKLIEMFYNTKYRLCCTATPAPNDHIELGYHAEFLSVCKQSEMLAMFFINANKEHTLSYGDIIYRRKGSNKNGTEWRLKHHAETHFFKWLASWAITMTRPSDLGYDDDGFILPPLEINPIYISGDYKSPDQLFFTHLHGISDRARVRSDTALSKTVKCVKLIVESLIDGNIREDDICQEGIKNIENNINENITSNIENTYLMSSKNVENLIPKELNKKEIIGISNIENEYCLKQRSIINPIEVELLNELPTIEKITQNQLKKQDSKQSMALIYKNTKDYLQNREDDVQYVENKKNQLKIDYTSITNIQLEELEACFVGDVIKDWDNLKMTLIYWLKHQNILKGSMNKCVVWCGLDKEQSMLSQIFGDLCVSVYGSLSPDEKEERELLWREGNIPIMLTKGKIFGHGMNWQHCSRMIFFGFNDSWELFYQCIRREWRYGQKNPVKVYIIMHEVEAEIYQNVMRKEAMAKRLKVKLIEQIKDYEKEELGMESKIEMDYTEDTQKGENWTAMLGDSCERLKEIPDNSIDLSAYSPPFADLFCYTASERDLGNSRDWNEFFEHYKYIIREVLRVTKPGRLTCVHTSDIPAMQQKDGYIGLRDFPGEVIRAYEREGWILHGRCFVPKNPQALKDGTMVLTPNGYIEINNLKIGDDVIGSDGKVTKVTGVYPHESRQMYRVTFSDHATIECDANHLWTVLKYRRGDWFTLTTKEILDSRLYLPKGQTKYEIPLVKAIELKYRALLVDPYLVGVLIGDGLLSSRSVVGMCTDHEIVKMLKLPDGCSIHMQPNTECGNGTVGTYFITYNEWHKNPVLDALRKYGLYGARAWDKFIPFDYLNNTIEVRKELLRGLLDTDGTIKKKNNIYYTTTSHRLALDIRELVLSLGGLCTIKNIDNQKYTCQGEERYGRRQYFMSIQIDNDYCPFKVKSKIDRWKIRSRTLRRKIKKIELSTMSTCTCITVDNPDGLFVADNYILTHNSQAIRTHSSALLFVSLRRDSSDSRPALVDQILLFKKDGENQVPVLPVKNGEIDNETWIQWANGIWSGISESDTLQFTKARGTEDEKHICPLQLGTIERCIKLYSNPKEIVLSPFMGIGSECYQAIKFGRKAIGIELKPEYWSVACTNLKRAESEANVQDMFAQNGVKV